MTVYKWAEMSPRERDDLVARKVMGHEVVWCIGEYWYIGEGMDMPLPCYTTDISAAWEVLDTVMAEGWEPDIEFNSELRKWQAWIGHNTFDAGYGDSMTAPEAICLAALRAKGVDVE